MKILVVDDDKEIAQLLEIYIKNEGYEPVTAYNGKEALTKLHTTPDIGLMILDIMMPEMNGIEVIKEVRKDSELPILILSAKTDDMDKIQGLIDQWHHWAQQAEENEWQVLNGRHTQCVGDEYAADTPRHEVVQHGPAVLKNPTESGTLQATVVEGFFKWPARQNDREELFADKDVDADARRNGSCYKFGVTVQFRRQRCHNGAD